MALWWLYFDRSAEAAAQVSPSRLTPAGWAVGLHLIHPVMVAGIIVSAAADEQVLSGRARSRRRRRWMILGGAALFLAGHAAFKPVVWRRVSWPRVAGDRRARAAGAGRAGDPGAGPGRCAAAVVVAVAAADRLPG